MTREEATAKAVQYWMAKARTALDSARAEEAAGRLDFAINRSYYAAFYAASAVLLKRGHRFAKHAGVRAGVHRHLVKTGLLSEDWGRSFDRLFRDRQAGDYVEFVDFEASDVREMLEEASGLVDALEGLLD